MKKTFFAAIIIAISVPGLSAQEERITDDQWNKNNAPASVTNRQAEFLLASKDYALDRNIRVQLPRNYSNSRKKFPVIYVLDADWNFPIISSYIDFLSFWGRIPETIVIGIDNLNRNSDFVDPKDNNFPLSGHQNRFLNFVKNELKPTIKKRYRTDGFDTIFGHSFGGVATLAFLFKMPGLFDAHIAIGTSTWVAERNSFEIARQYFASKENPKAFLYLSHAEYDGGDTVPANFEFWAMLKRENAKWLETHVSEIADTNHFTAVLPSLYEAIEALYPTKEITQHLPSHLANNDVNGFTNWIAETSNKYGSRFHPQLMELGTTAISLANEGNNKTAIALTDWLIEQNAENPQAYAFAAQVHLAAGSKQKAKSLLDDALKVAKDTGFFPNQRRMYQRFRQQLEN